METVTKILIKMRPLSTDGAILILVVCALHLHFGWFFILAHTDVPWSWQKGL